MISTLPIPIVADVDDAGTVSTPAIAQRVTEPSPRLRVSTVTALTGSAKTPPTLVSSLLLVTTRVGHAPTPPAQNLTALSRLTPTGYTPRG